MLRGTREASTLGSTAPLAAVMLPVVALLAAAAVLLRVLSAGPPGAPYKAHSRVPPHSKNLRSQHSVP